ncbi:enoyl-CoA hydratase/isomerase family protein [Polycyclovorans algicola]|uniref:enoyl-CoA hydratase/isomerase family protein n=1 Tax=Polycyclovorans algicola TaxID=616992 RepID=UPI0004A6E79F|nr:enoyl-CoA hydratase/isomerase family protein [Polycyclovorans algicola]
MAYESLQLQVTDGVAHLILNQPKLGNPFNAAFCADLGRVGGELAGRKDVRAVLLKANGDFFSVGGDVKMFSQSLDGLPNHIREWAGGLHTGVQRLARLDAPIVAAVHATAMGGAVGLLAGCDLVYCARSAKLGGAYTKIGYTCDMGATFTLASRMGLSRARRFLLLGEVLSAEEGLQCGLVDYLVDDATLQQEAEAAAVRLANGPTRAYGELRRLFTTALSQGFERQLEDEVQSLVRAAATDDAREGILAFVERRIARFRGR